MVGAVAGAEVTLWSRLLDLLSRVRGVGTREPSERPLELEGQGVLASESSAEVLEVQRPQVKLTAGYSDAFFLNGVQMAARLGEAPFEEYLAVWENESGVSPLARNPHDESRPAVAVGLIQWTHAALGEGVDLDAFRRNHDLLDQLRLAEAYYAPHAPYTARGDIYGVTYVPARVEGRGRDPSVVLVTSDDDPRLYNPNQTLDLNKDGRITVGELADIATRAAERDARWPEFVARVRWAEAELGMARASLVTPTSVLIFLIAAVGAYAYWKA